MKPIRAFPLSLNIGTDICQISRIYRILRSPRAARFVQRVLTTGEQGRVNLGLEPNGRQPTSDTSSDKTWQSTHECLAQRDPEMWKNATFVAGRFAAKEAAMKAHSHRRLTFHDIIIERRGRVEARLGSGPPIARIKAEADEDEDASAMVSISHDGDYATAVCMGYDPSVVNPGEHEA